MVERSISPEETSKPENSFKVSAMGLTQADIRAYSDRFGAPRSSAVEGFFTLGVNGRMIRNVRNTLVPYGKPTRYVAALEAINRALQETTDK